MLKNIPVHLLLDLKTCSPATSFDNLLNNIFLDTLKRAKSDDLIDIKRCVKDHGPFSALEAYRFSSSKGSLHFIRKYEKQEFQGLFYVRYFLRVKNPDK